MRKKIAEEIFSIIQNRIGKNLKNFVDESDLFSETTEDIVDYIYNIFEVPELDSEAVEPIEPVSLSDETNSSKRISTVVYNKEIFLITSIKNPKVFLENNHHKIEISLDVLLDSADWSVYENFIEDSVYSELSSRKNSGLGIAEGFLKMKLKRDFLQRILLEEYEVK